MAVVAIIGGTGLAEIPGFEPVRTDSGDTPWGQTSHPLQLGLLAGREVCFLSRHGQPHRIPPHKINYRANMYALKQSGVRQILAINAVGGLTPQLQPGQLLVPDQLIDYTWGREHTYYDGENGSLEHVDFTAPYNSELRQALLESALALGMSCIDGGGYAATQGPRLETAAEVQRLQRDGSAVVGMTGMPEAALARELALAYVSLCIVVNPGAGLSDKPITLDGMRLVLSSAAKQVSRLLVRFLQQ